MRKHAQRCLVKDSEGKNLVSSSPVDLLQSNLPSTRSNISKTEREQEEKNKDTE